MSATSREASVLNALLHSPLGNSGAVDLAALVRDTVSSGVAREVLLLRLSELPVALRRGHHRRLLETIWEPLRLTSRTRVFDLPNGDLCAVEAPPAHHLARIGAQLSGALEGEAATRTVRHLRLPAEAAVVLATIEQALGLNGAIRAEPAAAQGQALQAEALIGAEKALAMADVTPMLRRLWVCRLMPGGGAPEPRWEERRIDLAAVIGAVLPHDDPETSPWLRRRLRSAIDRRVLAVLSRPDELRDLRECCLPLSIDAVCSPEFQKFEGLLPVALRGRVTISITAEEALADPYGFRFSREYLQGRGHRVAMETRAASAIGFLRPDTAGFDVLRLIWNDSLPALGTAEARAMAEQLPRDPERMVLANVDRPAAIAWGWELGFRLFSGRLIEQRRLAAA